MIVFVDNEHEVGYAGKFGPMIRENRIRIKYELEDRSGHECLIVRWNRVTPDLLDRIDAEAVFISGNSASPDDYDPAEQEGLNTAIQELRWPMFGFCGGHQVMGAALGAELAPIGELDPGDEPFGEANDLAPGMKAELGYFPIQVTDPHPILEGVGEEPIVRHAHSWELKDLPIGFSNYAATDMTPIQLMIHDDLPIVGAQFHPEYATQEHPAGRFMIENFLRWAGLIP